MIRLDPIKRFPHHPTGHHPEFKWWQPFIVKFYPNGNGRVWSWNIWVYTRGKTWLGFLSIKKNPFSNHPVY